MFDGAGRLAVVAVLEHYLASADEFSAIAGQAVCLGDVASEGLPGIKRLLDVGFPELPPLRELSGKGYSIVVMGSTERRERDGRAELLATGA